MSSKNLGPGVQRFWKARARGEDVDVEAIIREHPDEALALAQAIWEAARLKDSEARERMWLARTRVLSRSGEDSNLGSPSTQFPGRCRLKRSHAQCEDARTRRDAAANRHRPA